ncbi:uncharacterized protein TNCV_2508531 [Trichonephila clavipes]|nr:uncharacterized protein TNCV_2508531 [Trichonephila clavipes]
MCQNSQAGVRDTKFRWFKRLDKAIVPFVIDRSSHGIQNLIYQAFEQFHRRTCVRFVRRTNQKIILGSFLEGGAVVPTRRRNRSHSTARATIDLLKDTFGNRLISRFGPVNWPPRSCDLTPLDYFLWSYVKSLVYADKPQTLDHLEDNIRRVIADIRPQMLEKKSSKIRHPGWSSRGLHHAPYPEIRTYDLGISVGIRKGYSRLETNLGVGQDKEGVVTDYRDSFVTPLPCEAEHCLAEKWLHRSHCMSGNTCGYGMSWTYHWAVMVPWINTRGDRVLLGMATHTITPAVGTLSRFQFPRAWHRCKLRRRSVGVQDSTRNGRRDPKYPSTRCIRMVREDTGSPSEGAICA